MNLIENTARAKGTSPVPMHLSSFLFLAVWDMTWQKAGEGFVVEAQGDSDSTCLTRVHLSPSAPRRLCMLGWQHGFAWTTGTSSFHIPSPLSSLAIIVLCKMSSLSSIYQFFLAKVCTLMTWYIRRLGMIQKCMPTSCFTAFIWAPFSFVESSDNLL